MNGTINMAVIYGITAILSFILAVGYWSLVKKKEKWLLLILISVFVVNAGYFALSISKTLEEALLANRISYFGSVFLPLFMFLTIMDVCQIKYNKIFFTALVLISIAIFIIAASGGYLDIYYKKVSIEFVNGAARLIKEYGPLHILYHIYLFLYFGVMVGVILFSTLKKNGTSHKLAIFLAAVVLGNVGIWFIEQLIPGEFDFLSISYIITELLLLLLYSILHDENLGVHERQGDGNADKQEGAEEKINSMPETEIKPTEEVDGEIENVLEMADIGKVPNSEEKNIFAALPEASSLTARELEVLVLILENKKRKDIADELHVSENTVKKHTSHIFAKLGVSNRKELFGKIK